MEDRDFKLPPKSRDVYLYFPYRMLRIFPTVMLFGNLDLTTGERLGRKRFIVTRPRKITNSQIILGKWSGYRFEKRCLKKRN